jgi:hypothetical protein
MVTYYGSTDEQSSISDATQICMLYIGFIRRQDDVAELCGIFPVILRVALDMQPSHPL